MNDPIGFPRSDEEHDEEDEKPGHVSAPIVRRLLETRTVLVCGAIQDDMARDVMAQLLVLDAQSSTKPIRVVINSPGGSVDAGFAIFDTMRFVNAPLHTLCAGLAASAATIILMGARKEWRFSLPNTRYLIHQPSMGVQGQASDVEIGAREIIKLRQKLDELLAAETGQPIERIAKDRHRDYWMSAEEAQQYGLITTIVTNASALPS